MEKTITALFCIMPLAFSFAGFAETGNLFTRLTQHSSMQERQAAIDEMQSSDAGSKNALVTELKDALKDSNPRIRKNAAEDLGALDSYADSAMPDLVQLEKDPVADVRNAASASLARLGKEETAFITQLIARLDAPITYTVEDKSGKISRYEAADTLGFIAAGMGHIDLSPAVPALSRTVQYDPDTDVRNRAAWALGTMGKQAHAALPALRTAAKDPEESNVASWALERIGH